MKTCYRIGAFSLCAFVLLLCLFAFCGCFVIMMISDRLKNLFQILIVLAVLPLVPFYWLGVWLRLIKPAIPKNWSIYSCITVLSIVLPTGVAGSSSFIEHRPDGIWLVFSNTPLMWKLQKTSGFLQWEDIVTGRNWWPTQKVELNINHTNDAEFYRVIAATNNGDRYSAVVGTANYHINIGGGPLVLLGGDASYGHDVYSSPNLSSAKSNGAVCSVQGFVTGGQSFSVGLSGVAAAQVSGCTNLATSGVSVYPPNGRGIGLYGRVTPLEFYQESVHFPNGALVLDVSKSVFPAIVIVNGSNTIFEVTTNGTIRYKRLEQMQ